MTSRILEIARAHRALAIFFLSYYVALIVYGAAVGSTQVVFYALFVALGAWIVARLYVAFQLSGLVLWGLAVWGLAHIVRCLIKVDGRRRYEWCLNDSQMRLDKVYHFLGFWFQTFAVLEIA